MKFAIVTFGRAGSTLLMNYLYQFGLPKIKNLSQVYGTDISEGAGIKLAWGDINKIEDEDFSLSRYMDSLGEVRYIYLTRNNHVEQSISMIKHLQCDRKHITSETELEEYREWENQLESIPLEDFNENLYQNIRQDIVWEQYFSTYNIEPLRITFEELISGKAETTRKVYKFIQDKTPPAIELVDNYQRVRSHVDKRWYAEALRSWTRLF